jgi:hypothetical protein
MAERREIEHPQAEVATNLTCPIAETRTKQAHIANLHIYNVQQSFFHVFR